MTRKPEVAVIIPTYNRRELVLQAVSSVLDQTFADLLCLVVDNGSTDGTVEALAGLGDERARVLVTEKPIGGPAARNLGMAAAEEAEWVAFLDSDDIWAPNKLEFQLKALHDHPAARWSTTACVDIGVDMRVRHALRLPEEGTAPAGESGLMGSDEVRSLLLTDNRVPAGNSTVMASRSLLADLGGFDPKLATCDDWDLWLRLASASPLAYVDLPLAAYRIWDGQSSSNERAFIRDAATVRARHFPGSGPLPRQYVARWQREAARRHVAGGRRWQAAGNYARAAWTGRNPGQLVYAAAAVGIPSVAEKRLRRVDAIGRMPTGWEAEVEPWLSKYRN